MKQSQPFLYAILIVLLGGLSAARALAQEDVLPPELKPSSSLSEIFDYLNKTGFAQARIGLDLVRYRFDSLTGEWRDVHESAVFSQGFKLAKADGCTLILRNEDVKLLSFGTTEDHDKDTALRTLRGQTTAPMPYPAELYVRLDRAIYTRGKAAYLHTKDKDRARALGSWRTKVKLNGRAKEVVLFVKRADSRPDAGQELMYGDAVSFTFDDRETSMRFNTVLRCAVRICNGR